MFYAIVKIQNKNVIRESVESFLKEKVHHETSHKQDEN